MLGIVRGGVSRSPIPTLLIAGGGGQQMAGRRTPPELLNTGSKISAHSEVYRECFGGGVIPPLSTVALISDRSEDWIKGSNSQEGGSNPLSPIFLTHKKKGSRTLPLGGGGQTHSPPSHVQTTRIPPDTPFGLFLTLL